MRSQLAGVAAASLISLAITAAPALGAELAASDSIPRAIEEWFDMKAPAIAPEVVFALDADWSAKLEQGAHAWFGSPSRQFTLTLPHYDVASRSVSGAVDLASTLTPTDIYCAATGVEGSAVLGTICAQQDKDGTADFFIGGTENLLPTVKTLPAAGYIDIPLVGMFSFDRQEGTVAALDASANDALGARPMEAATLATRIARHLAEDEAIARVSGPPGGGMDLRPASTEKEARRALAAAGLNLPDDLAWHEGVNLTQLKVEREARGFGTTTPDDRSDRAATRPATTPEAAAAVASSESSMSRSAVWITLIVVLIGGAGITTLLARRRSTRETKP